MYGPIRIPGVRILAQAFLSRGEATDPCSAFVGFHEEKGEYFHATYNHRGRFYFGSLYWHEGPSPQEALENALHSFTNAVKWDAHEYLGKGIPQTEGDLSESTSLQQILRILEESYQHEGWALDEIDRIIKAMIPHPNREEG